MKSIADDDLTPDRMIYDATTWAIDPDGCVDVDDAISIKIASPDETEQVHEIGIHIADPTSYIIEGSELDRELVCRSESMYPRFGAIHMLPIELTQMFSLTAGKTNRAFSVILRVKDGQIIEKKICKTLIKLDRNLTYREFDNIVSRGESAEATTLSNVGRIMYEALGETDKYDSKKLVQVMMIHANSAVAEQIIDRRDVNSGMALIRSQPVSNICVTDTGVGIGADAGMDVQYVMDHMRMTYKSARLKLYSGNAASDQHATVGMPYTHFTSPIRRYSDMLVHRLLWNTLIGKRYFAIEPLVTNHLETLFWLNHNKQHYRRIVTLEQDRTTYRTLITSTDERTFEFNAVVVFVDSETTCIVRLVGQVEQDDKTVAMGIIEIVPHIMDKLYRAKIIDSKMLESVDNVRKVELYEKVQVAMTFTVDRVYVSLL